MEDAPEGDIGSLKILRWLVTTLMVVMIVGFIVLIGFLVTRFPNAPEITLPESIKLPDGTTAEAFTATADWYAIVTTNGQILVYDRTSDALIKTIDLSTQD